MSKDDSKQPPALDANPELEPVFCEIRREMLELADVDVLDLIEGAHP
jgi:hypothetical protein